jgi:hypothetical protein
MKATEWEQALRQYRDRYGKVVFTPTELANISGHSMPVLKNTLRRLRNRGILQQYAAGKYGLPGAAEVESLVSAVCTGAYITGLYALYKHGVVTQTPRRIHVFTNRRHNRSRIRTTELGTLVFVCVQRPVYSYPHDSVMAGPEQAFCDFVYRMRRQGLSANSLVSFRKLGSLDRQEMECHLSRYPRTVAGEVHKLLLAAADSVPV